jgi:hypothetical protein
MLLTALILCMEIIFIFVLVGTSLRRRVPHLETDLFLWDFSNLIAFSALSTAERFACVPASNLKKFITTVLLYSAEFYHTSTTFDDASTIFHVLNVSLTRTRVHGYNVLTVYKINYM